ncbi:unnamed protein product [Closterium sp. NIES-65]|nr:unnamed protein product [Closterium sp. NIES-65]
MAGLLGLARSACDGAGGGRGEETRRQGAEELPAMHEPQGSAVDGGSAGSRPAMHEPQWGAVDGGSAGSRPARYGASGGGGGKGFWRGDKQADRALRSCELIEFLLTLPHLPSSPPSPRARCTSHKGVLWMAGQLGLHPAVMELVGRGARQQADRALRSCEAVAAVVKGRGGAVGWGKGGGESEEEGSWGGGSGGGASGRRGRCKCVLQQEQEESEGVIAQIRCCSLWWYLDCQKASCHLSNTAGHTSAPRNQLAGMSLGEAKEGLESAEEDKKTGANEVDRAVGDAADADRQRGAEVTERGAEVTERGAEVTESVAEEAAGRREGDEGAMQRRVAEGGVAVGEGAEGVSIAGRGMAAAGAFCRVHLWVEQARGAQRGGCDTNLSVAPCAGGTGRPGDRAGRPGDRAGSEAGGEGEGMESCADGSLVDGVAGECVRVLSDALHVARLDWPDVAMLRVYVSAGGPIPIPALSLALKTHLSKSLHNRAQSLPSHESPASSHQHGPSATATAAAAVPCPIVVPVAAVGPTAAADALLAVEMTAFGA